MSINIDQDNHNHNHNAGSDDHDDRLDAALNAPLLQVPDDFSARVMAALPAQPGAVEPQRAAVRESTLATTHATPSAAPRVWRVLQAVVMAACGTLGAVEVLLFVSGLWSTTALAVG